MHYNKNEETQKKRKKKKREIQTGVFNEPRIYCRNIIHKENKENEWKFTD